MNSRIYFDNAATTQIDPEVAEYMCTLIKENYGNPSSVHYFGRQARSVIEQTRKKISALFNCSPGEILFTGGGTEADNMIIKGAIRDLGVTRIISSPIEHHAVLHSLDDCQELNNVKVDMVKIDEMGYIDMTHLEELLKDSELKTLVCLMHGNNEIGNLIDLKKVGDLCKENAAYFHSDTVQTMGHYAIDFSELNIDFAACSAHKFHGPKGVGFAYVNGDLNISPLIVGGSQERNQRAGTENLYGIAALGKALEIAYEHMSEHAAHIQGLKYRMMEKLESTVPGITFNGDPKGESLYTVLSVNFPKSEIDEMLLYNLDIEGIAASGGSACSSGSNVGSHVLNALGKDTEGPAIRFSFGRFNTVEEVDYCVKVLGELFQIPVAS